MNKKLISRSSFKNNKERVVMGIYMIAKVIDALVFFLSLTFITSELGHEVIFNPTLCDWAE